MCWHPFPGFSGIILGPIIFFIFWKSQRAAKDVGRHTIYETEPGGFEPTLTRYVHLAEIIVTLATGSIVFLVGSSSFHKPDGHLPWSYTSPLLLLVWSALFGITFITWLTRKYEMSKHETQDARVFPISFGLGFGMLSCFFLGYAWLIFLVTR